MKYYQQIYERYYFPIFESLVKNRETALRYFNSLKSQWDTRENIEYNQSISLSALLRYVDRHCPYYKKLLMERGIDSKDIFNVNDMSKLPILTKNIIRNNIDNIISTKERHAIWKKSTGGSTGQPLSFAYTKESYEWRVAMSKRGYAWAGGVPGAKQAYIWGVQLGNIGRLKQLKEQLHQIIDRHLYFNCFDFDEKVMNQCLVELNRFKPAAVIGYTNPLYNLAMFIGENSKVKFVPEGIICAAEKVHPYQREVIERVFGAKVFNTYGSREFMLIAAECEKHEGLHVSAENLIVEIIKDDGSPAKEGDTGKIIVTDLHNYGMPFIRYEIGDLGVATMKSCSCGRGLSLIADVVGRSLDMIKTPEGKIVPGEFFPHLMKDFPDIIRFQVIQKKIDQIVIKLATTNGLSEVTKNRIDIEVRNVVGPTMVIFYEAVADIPLTSTGKYRVTISKLTGGQYD